MEGFRDGGDRDVSQQGAKKRFSPPRKIGIEQRKRHNQASVAGKNLRQVVEPSRPARMQHAVEHFKGDGFVSRRRFGVQRRKLPHSVRRQCVAVAHQYQRDFSAPGERNGRRQMGDDKVRLDTQQHTIPRAKQPPQPVGVTETGSREDVAHARRGRRSDLPGRHRGARPEGRLDDLDCFGTEKPRRLDVLDRGHDTNVKRPKAPGEAPQRHDVAHASAELPGQKNCFHRRLRPDRWCCRISLACLPIFESDISHLSASFPEAQEKI